MTISQTQIVDYLYKKVGYGVAKTDTSTNKGPANESNASPLLSPGTTIYQQDYLIPQYSAFSQLTANSTVTAIYRQSLSSVVQCVALAEGIANETWTTGYTDWIPPSLGGSGYLINVYVGPAGNPNSAETYTQLNINGSGNSDSWQFDYQSGILNFGDTNVPTSVAGNVIYIEGARYTGVKGISTWSNIAVTGNITSTSGNVVLTNGNVYAQNYYGTFQGTLGSGTSINLANVASYDVITPVSTSTNTFYPELSNLSVAGNSITGVSTNLSFVPSSGTLTTTIFSGNGVFTTAVATNLSSANAVITGGYVNGLANLTATTAQATNLSSGNAVISGGYITALANATITTGNVSSLYATTVNATAGNVTTGYFGSLNTANAVISGGYISALTNATITTGNVSSLYATTVNATAGNVTTGYFGSLNTANAVITGGYISALTNATITTGNVSSLYATTVNATAGNVTTGYFGSLNTANAVISGGYISALTNATITTGSITNLVTTTAVATNLSSANAVITGGYVNGLANLTATTAQATNLSSGNARITGGYSDNLPIGANIASTGAFTSLTASGITTVTSSAPATSTTTGALQVTGGVGIGGNLWVGGVTNISGNVTIGGNLSVTGNSVSIGASTLSINDPIINLNTPADLTPLTVPTTADIGLKFHYYDSADSAAFVGRTNADGYLTWWSRGTDTANVFSGTAYGTIKAGALILANSRVVGGGLTANTGTMQVYGDGSVSGNLFVGGNLTPGNVSVSMTTGTVMGNVANFNYIYGTIYGTLSGTTSTANVSLYQQLANGTNNQSYYIPFYDKSTGNASAYTNSAITFNPSTGVLFNTTLNATNGVITTLQATNFNTANAVISGGYISALTNATITTATITTATITTGSITNLATTTATVTNLASGNVAITGGYVNGLANITAVSGTIATVNATAGNTTTGYFGSLNTANAVISGGYISALTNATITTATITTGSITNLATTTAQAANLSSGNAVITGGYVNGLANITAVSATIGTVNATAGNTTTGYFGSLNTANAVISGGYITALANATITTMATGTATAATVNATAGNVTTGYFGSLNTANAVISGGYVNGLANLTATTAQATNFSSGNIYFTGTTAGTVNTSNVSLYEQVTALNTNQTFYPMFSNTNVTGGNTISGVSTGLSYNPSTGTLSATVFNGTITSTTSSFTTLQATNFSSGNVAITGGYVNGLANITAITGTIGNINVSAANVSGALYATSLNTANAVITGGYVNGLANLTATTAQATNFSSGNIYASGTTAGTWSTANVALSTQLATSSVNASFYPAFYNIVSGNAVPFTNASLSYNPSTGIISAGTFSGAGSLTTLSTSGVTTHNANVVIASGSATNNNTTGALVITGTGGIAIAGNINSAGQLFVGSGAQATLLVNAIAVKRGTSTTGAGNQFTQDGLINATNTGSSDFTAYGNNYAGPSNDHGWVDMGFTGDAFNDPMYTITKPNDGYLFASGANTTVGGNLVLSTDSSGSYNDIVIGIGGFYSNSEVARFHGNTTTSGYLNLAYTTNSSPTANTGALRVQGGTSVASNLYVGGATLLNGGQTAGYDVIVRGKSDSTLIWARPGTSYDQVVVGNSATTATLVTGAKLIINSTDSMIIPTGSTSQRPSSTGGTDTAGMLRFNNTSNSLEYYNGTVWQTAGSSFTVVTDTQFNGDGATTTFSSSSFSSATTNGLIVSINGVVQIPTLAYSLTSTTITFTEAPAVGDVIDVRVLTTTSTITAIASINGYMGVSADNNGVYVSTGTSSAGVYNWFNTAGAFVSNIANVSVAAANTITTIDTIDNTVYRSAKYIVQVTNGANYQTAESLVISNGTTATIVTYATISTNGNLGVMSATQSGSTTLIQFTAANATNNVRVLKQYIMI